MIKACLKELTELMQLKTRRNMDFTIYNLMETIKVGA